MRNMDKNRSKETKNLPNFFILGAAKSGTTSLHAMLSQHPQIYMSRHKEPQFFFNDEKYRQGIGFYEKQYFSGSDTYTVRGEASPSYFHAPDRVATRMKKNLSVESLRFVVILRDPVERAWSHYKHRVRVCAENCSFEEALEREEQRLKENPTEWVGYFKDGLYGHLVMRWLTYFSMDQFLFIDYAEFKHDWRKVLRKICSHVGVAADVEWESPVAVNVSGVARNHALMKIIQKPRPQLRFIKLFLGTDRVARMRTRLNRWNTQKNPAPAMRADTWVQLRKSYLDDIVTLEKILGWDLGSWKSLSNVGKGVGGNKLCD